MRFSPERLRQAMGERRAEELAAAIGVSFGTIRNWQTGRTEPTASSLAALAKHLGKPMEYFMSDSGEAA